MTVFFDGQACAAKVLARVKKRLQLLAQPPTLATVYFAEDPGSVLYTHKKQAACQQLGAKFLAQCFSFATPTAAVLDCLQRWAHASAVTGLMVQKPRRACYEQFWATASTTAPLSYDQWWRQLVAALPPTKDVDGLSPTTQKQIAIGQATVLPATVSAVVQALAQAPSSPLPGRRLIIGRTDLLGRPLAAYWQSQNYSVTLVGRQQLAQLLTQPQLLRDFEVIVSAIGQPNAITLDQVKPGVVLIDVGEPRGDFDLASLSERASFVTPVPGGIGPLTVACLLENLIILSELHR